MTVDVISKLAIKNAADSPIIDASSAKKGFAVVADNTERDAILASVKLGGYIVFNQTSENLELWNGTAWEIIDTGSTLDVDDSTITLTGSTLSVKTNGVSNSQLRQGVACSIVCRSGNSTGNLADLQIANNDEIPMRTSNALVSAKIANPNIATGADIAWAKLASSVSNRSIDDVKSFSFDSEIDNSTTTIDFTTGSLQKKTLAANTTLSTPTPPQPFTDVRIRFIQAASGGPYTLTFWSGIIWDGSIVPVMPTAAGSELFVAGYYDGTNWRLSAGNSPATAAGQQRIWDGSAWRLIGLDCGTDLTNADQTLTIDKGAFFLKVALTATRNKTLSLTGQSSATKKRTVTIYSLLTLGADLVVKDASTTTLNTFVSGTGPFAASFQLNDAATAWFFTGWSTFTIGN